MAYRFFQISVRDRGLSAEELNRFLRGHRILSVERRWVDLGTESFWSFCVDYLETVAILGTRSEGSRGDSGQGGLPGGPESRAIRGVCGTTDVAANDREGRCGARLRNLHQRATRARWCKRGTTKATLERSTGWARRVREVREIASSHV